MVIDDTDDEEEKINTLINDTIQFGGLLIIISIYFLT